MQLTKGDLWKGPYAGRVVPTNGMFKRSQQKGYEGWPEAVMGAGVALQAAQRHPFLPFLLGQSLLATGNHVYVFDMTFNGGEEQEWIFTFPTKQHWQIKSNPYLIEQSAEELAVVVRALGLESVILPAVGCGLGGLSWNDVHPILERHLGDTFHVVHFEGGR